MISFPFPRSAPREVWRWWYRAVRIYQRESLKAMLDGGAVRISADGFINHIRPEAIYR